MSNWYEHFFDHLHQFLRFRNVVLVLCYHQMQIGAVELWEGIELEVRKEKGNQSETEKGTRMGTETGDTTTTTTTTTTIKTTNTTTTGTGTKAKKERVREGEKNWSFVSIKGWEIEGESKRQIECVFVCVRVREDTVSVREVDIMGGREWSRNTLLPHRL